MKKVAGISAQNVLRKTDKIGLLGVMVGLSLMQMAPAYSNAHSAAQAGVEAGVEADPYDFEHMSCTGAPFEIRVVVTGVREATGRMASDLYRNDQENYLNVEGREQQVRFAAKAPETKYCMHAPKEGKYAIAIYHDENANGLFDKKAFGLPAEPWGLSGTPRIGLRKPSIERSLFDVPQSGAQVTIKLRH